MLVMVRKEGQSVKVGDDIEVAIVQIRRGYVRIGFKAPDSVAIVRDDAIRLSPPPRGRWPRK